MPERAHANPFMRFLMSDVAEGSDSSDSGRKGPEFEGNLPTINQPGPGSICRHQHPFFILLRHWARQGILRHGPGRARCSGFVQGTPHDPHG